VKKLESLDIKTTLRTTLTKKQELVRDYQSFAKKIDDSDISAMFSHFAETEASQATQIKDKLNSLH
jgi:rubrerythrin